jgi:F-type H+-transporting ATPase subunit epsilon
MKLEILTPQEKLYDDEIEMVSLPGTIGSFSILKNHAPIISTLTSGEIKIIDKNKNSIKFAIKNGLVEASNNFIYVLAQV